MDVKPSWEEASGLFWHCYAMTLPSKQSASFATSQSAISVASRCFVRHTAVRGVCTRFEGISASGRIDTFLMLVATSLMGTGEILWLTVGNRLRIKLQPAISILFPFSYCPFSFAHFLISLSYTEPDPIVSLLCAEPSERPGWPFSAFLEKLTPNWRS